MEALSGGQQPLLLGKEATLSRGVPEGKSGMLELSWPSVRSRFRRCSRDTGFFKKFHF
jgi:hypothetical protein